MSGSKLDLNFCGPRVAATAPAVPNIDSHGNSLPPLTPQSNNNSSPIHDEPLTPAGEFSQSFYLLFNNFVVVDIFIFNIYNIDIIRGTFYLTSYA